MNVKMDVNGNAEGGKWKNLGSEVEKKAMRTSGPDVRTKAGRVAFVRQPSEFGLSSRTPEPGVPTGATGSKPLPKAGR